MSDNNKRSNFDLEERTAKFGERIIILAKKIPKAAENIPIIGQMVAAGTSIGANYCEATEAESKKDFIHKICIAKKETKESKFWLRMVGTSEPQLKDEARELWQEAQELNLIFSKIIRSCKAKREDD